MQVMLIVIDEPFVGTEKAVRATVVNEGEFEGCEGTGGTIGEAVVSLGHDLYRTEYEGGGE